MRARLSVFSATICALAICFSGAGAGVRPDAATGGSSLVQEPANQEQKPGDARQQAQQLYQLAEELKSAVDKTDENVLSLQVVRRAEAIEKLAHELRQKIKEHPAGAPKK